MSRRPIRLPGVAGLPRPKRRAAHVGDRPGHAHSLIHDRNFLTFWAGQTFSVLGDAIALIALPLLVLEATDSVARMGQITAVHGAGALVAGLAAGPIVDRFDRRRLMIQCHVGRLACFVLIPVLWWTLPEPLWALYALAFVGAGFGMVFGVAYVTAVANLVDRDQILDANGKLQTTFALSYVLGPMLAGILFGAFGAGALLITASTYAISIGSLGFVRLRRASATRADAAAPKEVHPRRRGRAESWLAGFRFLYVQPVFRSLTLLMGAFAFLSTGTLDLIIFHLREDLGQSDQTVGIVFGLASVGAIVAGILTTRIRHRWGFGPVLAAAFVVQGITILLIGLSGAVLAIVLIAMVYTFAETTRGTTTMTLRQELTPDHLLGRVTAAFWIAFSVPGPIGAAALTAIAEDVGAGASLVGIGVIGMAIGTVAIFTPAGQRRPRLVEADVDDLTPYPLSAAEEGGVMLGVVQD